MEGVGLTWFGRRLLPVFVETFGHGRGGAQSATVASSFVVLREIAMEKYRVSHVFLFGREGDRPKNASRVNLAARP
jgi:hypothetical protein